MPDVGIAIQVAQDRTSAAIKFTSEGHPAQQLVLTLSELDTLIGALGKARSRMVERLPSPDFESADVAISTAAHTKWHIKAYPPEGALVAFYHPQFGPVGFTLPRDQIAQIVGFLTDRFILQPAPSAEKH